MRPPSVYENPEYVRCAASNAASTGSMRKKNWPGQLCIVATSWRIRITPPPGPVEQIALAVKPGHEFPQARVIWVLPEKGPELADHLSRAVLPAFAVERTRVRRGQHPVEAVALGGWQGTRLEAVAEAGRVIDVQHVEERSAQHHRCIAKKIEHAVRGPACDGWPPQRPSHWPPSHCPPSHHPPSHHPPFHCPSPEEP